MHCMQFCVELSYTFLRLEIFYYRISSFNIVKLPLGGTIFDAHCKTVSVNTVPVQIDSVPVIWCLFSQQSTAGIIGDLS